MIDRPHHTTRIAPSPTGELRLRPAGQDDIDLLWNFLAIASYEKSAAAAQAAPIVAVHLKQWQRTEDFGFVAEIDGVAQGAAWARQFTPYEGSEFYVDEHTPEVAIGVIDGARGQGVGEFLMRALIAEATHRQVQLCLNVRETNPAVRLYERVGFQHIPNVKIRNRVGGLSIGMLFRPPQLKTGA